MLAKREHEKNLIPVLTRALKEAKLLKKTKSKLSTINYQLQTIFEHEPDLYKHFLKFVRTYAFPPPTGGFDAIAVTVGPGLEPALWAGVNFARALSLYYGIPLVPVDHMAAHVYSNWMNKELARIPYPNLALLVSGGHTQLVLMKKKNLFEILGGTRDDAVGEAYDKVAKMLGLGFPGGPLIEKLARKGDPAAFAFPRPMMNQNNLEFSFSGLKTAVLYELQKHKTINPDVKSGPRPKRRGYKLKTDVAASFQQAVIDVLLSKTIKAARAYRVKNIIVGGGVIANKKIRESLAREAQEKLRGARVYFPALEHSMDNGLMVAIAGYFNYKKGIRADWRTAKALPNLRIDEKFSR